MIKCMLLDYSIPKLSDLLQRKEIAIRELVDEAYENILRLEPLVHGFITLRDRSAVLKEAEELQKNISKGFLSPLYGIPFSLKDTYNTRNVRTTAASKVLDTYIPPYSATLVERLISAGAVLIGKNTQDAWGHGASSENTDYEIVRNPWDTNRIAGGSSGGSAAVVASRMVSFAIGEDTGGSIRNPASMCNVSGLKVTYGRVSRYGSIAYASSLDTMGPMAKTVEDLAYILEVIAGRDKRDATSAGDLPAKYREFLGRSVQGKTIGVPKEFFSGEIEPQVLDVVHQAIKVFERLGMRVTEVSMPHVKYGVSIYYLIALSETSSNLARYDAVRYGKTRKHFTPETSRRIILGTYALSAGYAEGLYKKAQKLRTVLIQEYSEAFQKCDVLISPVTPGLPPKIGELISNPLRNFLEDLYTATVNLAGSPALALPAGFSAEGLPVGMQLIGKKFRESELFQIGYAYQQETDWHKQSPPIIKKS